MRLCEKCGGICEPLGPHLSRCKRCGNYFQFDDTTSSLETEAVYRKARELLNSNEPDNISEALAILKSLGDYKNSRELYDRYYGKADQIINSKKKRKKMIVTGSVLAAAGIGIIILIAAISGNVKVSNYKKAVSAYENGNYQEAMKRFSKLGEYEDSSEYVRELEGLLSDSENVYKKAVGYYEGGDYENAVTEFSKLNDYEDADDYLQKASEKLFEQANADIESGKLLDAKKRLSAIPEKAEVYGKAVALLSDAEGVLGSQLREKSYNEAVAAYNEGKSEEAQQLFMEAGNFKDSTDYLTKIGNTFYDNATKAYNEKNYKESGDYIEKIDTMEEWTDYSRALNLKDEVMNDYIAQIKTEGKRIYRSDGEEAMKNYVTDTEGYLISEDEVYALIGECYVNTVPLNELRPFTYGSWELDFHNYDHIEDILGNTYTYALLGYMDVADGENSCTFAIDKQFKYLTATVAVTRGNNNMNGIIRIYGDGRLLWADEKMKKDTKPYDIEVDVSGVTDLKIEMYGPGNLFSSGFSTILGNPVLSE